MKGTWLRIELWLARAGWPAIAGVLLVLIGLAVHLWWLPKQQGRLIRLETEYRRLLADMRTPQAAKSLVDTSSIIAERYAAFNTVLAPKASVPDLIKTVFGEAGKAGLTLAQAEYRMGGDKSGDYLTYQMILPVRGSYLKLREFVDGVLAAAPNAALEEVSFKRDGIGSPTADARLRLVFYLRDTGP